MTRTNIRNHPYHFEQVLQQSGLQIMSRQSKDIENNFTWLVFMQTKWVPFDAKNQWKLEQTLSLGGTFVDIQDSHFPGVNRVRVFPKTNYLSYLGVKYRLSRVMQPDAWDERRSPEASNHTPPSPNQPIFFPSPASLCSRSPSLSLLSYSAITTMTDNPTNATWNHHRRHGHEHYRIISSRVS
ncbi:uncharacterized protein BYT42DRAFT_573207 [Radiomyces spectabilis]|uniref:uncharacterized protein n=1 Tax=Radiomyces spectabilis TaxID=64574 RepID=UPI00222100D9|nr:uncharacterized protein BYT42DRAFT_573207 [Radiomyces spectabilis]KAI8376039.1 hypothetical protein BYT42DRAFT_573207 [Radiomyces spectabilis]